MKDLIHKIVSIIFSKEHCCLQ